MQILKITKFRRFDIPLSHSPKPGHIPDVCIYDIVVHVTLVTYKLAAVLSTSAVFHDCNSAINDVITRSQQVQCGIVK